MMLKDKVAVVYGAGGAVGGAVARAFALEGANVFLTGRHLAPVEAVAKDIVSAGGSAEAAEVDALDEQAVDKHLQSVIDKAGRVDISFNAVGKGTTVFAETHKDSGDFFTADGVFEFRETFHEVEHLTVTDGVVRVEFEKGRFHFFGDC